MTARLRSLAIVLPCRNEEESVERVVRAAIEHGAGLASTLEVIVVDDGSSDGTGQLASGLAKEDSRVRVVRNDSGHGYGMALRMGFSATTAEWVFYTDGDGQFDLSQLGVLLSLLSRADIVAGFRLNRAEGMMRRFNAWGWTRVVRLVFGLRVRDVDCAFKVLPGKFLRETTLVSNGALISAEILARARHAGLTWTQMGVVHRSRRGGRPSGASPRVIFRAFMELIRLSSRIRRGQ